MSHENDKMIELQNRTIEKLQAENKWLKEGGGCALAGPGRGDCEHFIGLPGLSIPGQHDGEDNTVDVYGKPNGWCWWCWRSVQIIRLRAENKRLRELLRLVCEHAQCLFLSLDFEQRSLHSDSL